MNVVISGAGLSGSTAAVILARAGHKVRILETRGHVGGNCRDEEDEGVTKHIYGPHLFHTNSSMVWEFLSKFTSWSNYRHEVVADTSLGRIPIPWSVASVEAIGRELADREITDLIFVDYSEKQWGVSFADLPAAIRNRVALRRDNRDLRYFTDKYQGQPIGGYSAMFGRMLEGIEVCTAVSAKDAARYGAEADLHIYTGKVDAFYGHCYGHLPYRSLVFEHTRSAERLAHATINQCNKLPWTRVYDHAYFSDQTPARTIITREYPVPHDSTNDPFYPMPFGEGQEIYARYRILAKAERTTLFFGRLATYRYLDMWMAVAQVLTGLKHLMSAEDLNNSFERNESHS